MKKVFYLIVLLVASISQLQAQTVGERGISTDPRAPINPDPNSPMGGGINQTTSSVENNFYWFNTNSTAPFNNKFFDFTYPLGNNTYTTSSIKNPYFQATSGPYVFANTDEVGGNDNSDYMPENGWELVKVDLGRLSDDITPRDNISELGYIALYNRYTGTMRFLGSLSKFSSSSKTIKFNIRLLRKKEIQQPNSFTNENSVISDKREEYYDNDDLKVTNLLSLHNDFLQPLDQKTSIFTTSVLTNFPGNKNGNYFFWFDVPLAYDPCVCKGKLMLAFSYEEIDSWTFEAKGTMLANYKASEAGDKDCNNAIPGQIIGGVLATAQAIATQGASIFASAGGFIGLIKAAACAAGMSPKDLKVLNVAGNVVEAAATVYDAANNLKSSTPKKTEDLFKSYYINGTDTIKRADIAAVIAKSTKFFTSAYSLDSIINAKEVKKAGGVQNNIQGVIDLKGTVNNKIYNWRDVLLAVPGSTWPDLKEESYQDGNGKTLPEYPIYNEALGTIAFLKTPQANALQSNILFSGSPEEKALQDAFKILNTTSPYYPGFLTSLNENAPIPPYNTFNAIKLNDYKRITVRLSENLYYYFNPKTHVNLEKTAVLAGFQYYVNEDNIQNSEMVDLDDLRELLFTFKPADSGKLYLKIAINFKSLDINSKGIANANLQVFTLPVNVMGTIHNDFNLFQNGIYSMVPTVGANGSVTSWTQSGIINNFSPSQIRGLLAPDLPVVNYLSPAFLLNTISSPVTVNQDKILYSDEEINVEANLSTTNNAKLILRSSKNINVKPGVEIGNQVFLEIGDDPYVEKYPQSPVSLGLVQDFCDKQNPLGIEYLADEFESKLIAPAAFTLSSTLIGSDILLYPNPASTIVNISNPLSSIISSTSIIDITGKHLFTLAGNISSIDVKDLISGLYIIQMQLQDGTTVSNKINVVR